MTSKAKTPVKKTTTKAAIGSKSAKTTSKAAVTTAKAAKTTSAAVAKAAPAATPVVVEGMHTVVSGPAMRKRELIDLVVQKSGVKKKDAKPVVEAMLGILGEAVSDGRELNLQPFGKIKVRRAKEMANARVMVTKIRQPLNKLPDAAE